MNGLDAAQRRLDGECQFDEDRRSDAEIEKDAADRISERRRNTESLARQERDDMRRVLGHFLR